jgi:hypothetical protein
MGDRPSTADAARALRTTLSHVYSLIWAGKLVAVKEDGRWLICPESLSERVRAKERK